MTDRYQEWRDFYAEKVRSWMSLEELRAECGMLQTADATSPEVLLIHAMHLLERYEQRNEAMRAEVERWKRINAEQVKLHVKAEIRAERLAEALETCLEMEERPKVIELAKVALAALSEENSND